jgi:PAS domain S-box-containing protein
MGRMMTQKFSLLTIDDDEALRRGVRAYFEDLDFEVLEAGDGETGLAVFRDTKPQVVLVDLRMPGMSGLEVIQVIAKEGPEIPVVVLSGTGLIGDAIDAIRQGAWDFVTKPIVEMSELEHVVSSVLERSRLRSETRLYREHLEQEVARRTSELTAINDRLKAIVRSTRAIAACAGLQEVSSRLLEEFTSNMAAEGGSIYLVEDGKLVLKYSLDEGHTTARIISLPPPEDSPIQKALETKQPLLISDLSTQPYIRPSGWSGYRNPSLLIFPLLDDRNEPIGVITLHNKTNPPFTEQDREIGVILSSYSCEAIRASRAIEALRESEERFKRLFQHSNDIICVTDENGIITFLSGPIETILGYKPEELIGTNHFERMHPDDLKPAEKAFTEVVMRPGFARRAEYRFRHEDGSWVPLESVGTNWLNDPNVRGVVLNVRDISERKKAEEALRRIETLYASVIENIEDVFYRSDTEGRLLMGSQSGARLFGYDNVEEMIGLPLDSFWVDPKDRQRLVAQIGESGRVNNFQGILKRKDGSTFVASFTTHFYRDESGNIQGTQGIIRDVTSETTLQKQLIQAQKMEAVGTLAGGIAHDFNNLLQAILGYTDLLLLRKDLDDPDRQKLDIIRHAARDGADLVARILTFGRKAEAKVRPIDLNEEIRKAEKLLRRTVPKMIEIKLVLADGLRIINADPAQIEQLLLNLAVNAQHAMPDGGQLLIETSNVSLSYEHLKTHLAGRPGKYVLLTVSDTGMGMTPDVLERIFEPFFTTKANGQGTGLGLSMVHGIVSQHEGYIRCYSEPGMGTSFNIYFPVSATEHIRDLAETREMPAFGTETILLVDDDDRIRDMAREMIEMGGYEALTAGSGEDALEMYSKHREEISLVILDLIMPGMGGKRCLEELLRIDPVARVIVASGYSSNGLIHHKLGSSAIGFVSKPYDAKDILGAIRKVLDRGEL